MPQLTYLEAIRQGIWEEMERDPTVFCLGETSASTAALSKSRTASSTASVPSASSTMPIAESAIVGAAFGASLTGMRPVAEFQVYGFHRCAFNQIREHGREGSLPLGRARASRHPWTQRRQCARRSLPFAESGRCGSCTHRASKWFARPAPTTPKV